MFDKTRDTKRLTNYFEAFSHGANPDGISVTRLGYTEVEDEMHALFVRMVESRALPPTQPKWVTPMPQVAWPSRIFW